MQIWEWNLGGPYFTDGLSGGFIVFSCRAQYTHDRYGISARWSRLWHILSKWVCGIGMKGMELQWLTAVARRLLGDFLLHCHTLVTLSLRHTELIHWKLFCQINLKQTNIYKLDGPYIIYKCNNKKQRYSPKYSEIYQSSFKVINYTSFKRLSTYYRYYSRIFNGLRLLC